jgi:hypothetical protein
MPVMMEEIKLIGSIVGLLTGVLYFYDRFVKGRPVASLTISREKGLLSLRIRISNASSYDVAIVGVTAHPKVYLLAEQEGAEGNLRASFGEIPSFMLKPSGEREVRIVPRFDNGVAMELVPRRVIFCVWWRRGNATWLPQLPIPVFTSTTTIQKFRAEKPDPAI